MNNRMPNRLVMILLLLGLHPAVAMAEALEARGITRAIRAITLSAPESGRIEKIHFQEGEAVPEGAVIVQLDAQLQSLEAERRKLVWHDRSALAGAKAREKALQVRLKTARFLFKKNGSVSREELDQRTLEHRQAETEVATLAFNEKQEQLDYQLADAKLARRAVKAPFAGLLIRRHLDEGENCDASQPLIELVDTTRGLFIGDLEEAVARTLNQGQRLPLEIAAGSGHLRREGEIIYIAPVADAASGLMQVKVVFDNADGAIHPGVRARLLIPFDP